MKNRGARAFALIALVFAMLAAACSSGGSDGGSTSGPAGSSGRKPPQTSSPLLLQRRVLDPAYMASFYKEYPDIDLETASFVNNHEAIAKLQAGFQADVINSCVDEATLDMANKGLYAPLHVSRLADNGNTRTRFLAFDEGVAGRPGSRQGLPGARDAGNAGIMYKREMLPTTPPDSWTDLFDPQWAGRASMEDISVTAIDIGALANGISDPLTMTPDQLGMVKNYLIDRRDQFRTFGRAAPTSRRSSNPERS